MKPPYFIRRLHLWLGLLIGVQVVIWMSSGVIMSWFHIAQVRGERNAPPDIAIELEARSFANPGGIIAQAPGAYELRLKHYLGRPVYEVDFAGGKALFDAQSGEKLSPVPEPSARVIARNAFIGEGEITRLEKLTDPPHEYGKPGPVWRATFNDRLGTRLYISPETGEIEARRNKIWRLYDFFWMLHIMDYDERENFNNPLLRAASAVGLVFAISGAVLVALGLIKGRFIRFGGQAGGQPLQRSSGDNAENT